MSLAPTQGAAICLAQAAFWWYSWMSPPRRSRRLISLALGLRTLRVVNLPAVSVRGRGVVAPRCNAPRRSKAASPGDGHQAP
jgi:hypothetical protein